MKMGERSTASCALLLQQPMGMLPTAAQLPPLAPTHRAVGSSAGSSGEVRRHAIAAGGSTNWKKRPGE